MLANTRQWRTACDIILKHKVSLTDELAEALSPPKEKEMKDEKSCMDEGHKVDHKNPVEFRSSQYDGSSGVHATTRKEVLSTIASMAKKQERSSRRRISSLPLQCIG